MASINGIQIKNLKKFKDHEGCEIAQGDVWYKGKKLGYWSQDYMCGPDTYGFDESVLSGEVEKYAASDYVEEKFKKLCDLDILLGNLVNIAEEEKTYKKGVKSGYKSYISATDGFHVKGYYTMDTDIKKIEGKKFHKDFVDGCKKEFFKDWNGGCTIYTSLKDFDITV